MECVNCKLECKTYIVDNLVISYCDNCWDFITQNFIKCENHKLEYVKFKNSCGSLHLKKQCFQCGQLEGRYYAKKEVLNFNNLPDADLILAEKFENIDYEKVNNIYKRYEEKRKKIKKEKSLNEFLEQHTEYLKTIEWKKKRNLVLNRDNYICQSCLECEATQVHHKSYRYWKNEPLFELISVCDKCHDSITEMNRDVVNFSRITK